LQSHCVNITGYKEAVEVVSLFYRTTLTLM
jgi:hypothetical protein